MAFTPSEAARAVGVARSTIYRKVKSKEMSVLPQADGSFKISKGELLRVFGELRLATSDDVSQQNTQHPITDSATETPVSPATPLPKSAEIERLRGDIRTLEATVEGLKGQITILERELSDAKNKERELQSRLQPYLLPPPKEEAAPIAERLALVEKALTRPEPVTEPDPGLGGRVGGFFGDLVRGFRGNSDTAR